MSWIIAANSKIYDHTSAFEKWGFIDWKQNNGKFKVGDIIYIYKARLPRYQCGITHMAKVIKINMTFDEIQNDMEFWNDIEKYYDGQKNKFMRLELLSTTDTEKLKFDKLLENGLNGNLQGKRNLDNNPILKKYIEENFNIPNIVKINKSSLRISIPYKEGNTIIKLVNTYERDLNARKNCIEFNGCYCHICNFNFENIYGESGKNVIDVHHIIPLHLIGNEYIVDPKTDLIPVCPNCHRMLHKRKENKSYHSIEDLKNLLDKHK